MQCNGRPELRESVLWPLQCISALFRETCGCIVRVAKPTVSGPGPACHYLPSTRNGACLADTAAYLAALDIPAYHNLI